MGIFNFFRKRSVESSEVSNEKTQDENDIELIKTRLNEACISQGDWQTPYHELMKNVYELPVLFFALSEEGFNSEDGTGIPLISNKDFNGTPALYIFSDKNTATDWMRNYEAYSKDKKYGLIGEINKETDDYHYVFAIANKCGAKKIMLDEGGSYVGLDLELFFEKNELEAGAHVSEINKPQMPRMHALAMNVGTL